MTHSSELLSTLEDKYRERVRIIKNGPCRSSFILYWMCTAMRSDENPALDIAIYTANRLSIPLLVYQGLSNRYPFASDRHHMFILEGARDVQQQLAKKGIPYIFHLEGTSRVPALKILANMSSLIITEDMPIPHLRSWTQKLSQNTETPFWKVDSACILPMSVSNQRYERAFRFRDDFTTNRNNRILQEWLSPTLEHTTPLPTLPVAPIDLQSAILSNLIAQCPIDHTIPPVQDTRGGSKAGYQRWKKFILHSIEAYHYKRNDPNAHGSSRMSAYLHYGQVSPFRLAREAARKKGKGAEKYLDELLIWRELSYHWCDKTPNPTRLSALPQWAQITLSQQSSTVRLQQQPWESLLRAKSPNHLWNLAQQSLLRHGELHNNLRMTWGKMLHQWTESPEQTIRWLLDLNNRLALDGRDPSSYGGLLWCLGLFDRPFPPSKKIYGTVRVRDEKAHRGRLNQERYMQHVRRNENTSSTAIVGAGISGLTCARTLIDQGHNVKIFDKARGPGGRTSTRISRQDEDWIFDHGLPFIQFTDPRFELWVKAWKNADVIRSWNPKIKLWKKDSLLTTERTLYVGNPKNSSVAEHLASEINVQTQERIVQIRYTKQGWILTNQHKNEHGPFLRLILTLPPEQLYELLPNRLSIPGHKVHSHPQHALMMRFTQPLHLEAEAIQFQHHSLYWFCKESSKPTRPPEHQWTLLTQPSWSSKHLEEDPKSLVDILCTDLSNTLQTPIEPVQHQIHRWRYAQADNPLQIGSWWNEEYQIGACGDWLHGGSIEGAFLSGAHLAGRLMTQ
ncbi:MAG: hypothetical protein CL916_07860 [Deltaproteobacteria bacterium]|nr:hypothetical protein [Deltaproteobacteria bacterium]